MSDARNALEGIINDFSIEKFTLFFRCITEERFIPASRGDDGLPQLRGNPFQQAEKIGEIVYDESEKVVVCAYRSANDLSERSSKKSQYDAAKAVIKGLQVYSAGIFVFYDQAGNFRFSLVYPESHGRGLSWSNFRRFTYFVSRDFTNKTFLKRIGDGEFSSLTKIKEAFAIGPVTDLFYNEFFGEYERLVEATKTANHINEDKTRDFILLFVIRTIFLGFIQKRKWLGESDRFIQEFFDTYGENSGEDKFYKDWLSILFFEALNNSFTPRQYLPSDIRTSLQLAPYLNGGLFKAKKGYDDQGWYIPDAAIRRYFDFLFSHSFTIEESSVDDSELQLNPEFLGIIFERLINKENGAVYTPRTEVDLMCRLSLVKWLKKNLESDVAIKDLYELFFREGVSEEDQKDGSFSPKEAKEILAKLGDLAICDPAAGSGAFLVGMMHVLDEIEQKLKERFNIEGQSVFERKKQIIAQSLYGVEVREWAVWIAQLRLWLSLFVEAPEELKTSLDPILPSLDFKVRCGDSLVQVIGSKLFSVSGHEYLSSGMKRKVTELKKIKVDYFYNKRDAFRAQEVVLRETQIYKEILDDEISSIKYEIRGYQDIQKEKQVTLFGDDKQKEIEEQTVINFNKSRLDAFNEKLNELEEQKRVLHANKPFIWSIEFAEIFVEKGGFDIVIGNPPYIRQEFIEDPTGRIADKRKYKDYLQEMVRLDFPNDFSNKTKIDAKSDLYAYFYIRALRLLNQKGIQSFICSNSWLDVGYGAWLQEFLLKRCSVELVIDNHAKRSFDAADVNTIISVINAPERKLDTSKLVRFVAFKKPFEESIFTENLLTIDGAQEIFSNKVFRVYPVSNAALRESGTEVEGRSNAKLLGGSYIGDKWGSVYLRSPDVIIKLKNHPSLFSVNNLGIKIDTGLYSGINEFFYIKAGSEASRSIEGEYLVPLIKSPQGLTSIKIDENKDIEMFVFLCRRNKDELRALHHNGALGYIEWGETQLTKKKGKVMAGIPWPKVASVVNRKPGWWAIKEVRPAHIFMQYGYNDRFLQPFTDTASLSDRRLHMVRIPNDYNHSVIAALLNTTLSALQIELLGRSNLGQGALDFATMDADQLRIPMPEVLNNSCSLLEDFFLRPMKSIFEECGIVPTVDVPIEKQEPKPLADRAALDNIVFDELGLTNEERKDVYRAVCRLVWNRISRANSV